MSNDDFRRELNSVFNEVSGSPSSNLPDRVRSAVAQPPAAREPYWLAAVAAVVIAVLVVGVLYVTGPLKPTSSQVGGVTSTPTLSVGTSPSAQPSPSPSPSAEQFVCSGGTLHTSSNATPPPLAYVSALRTGTHAGYDRLTVEFTNGSTVAIEVSVQSGTTFTKDPSGLKTQVKGQNGILITIRETDLHTSYTGSTDIVTGYKGLAEIKQVEDFEGVVQLALGVNGPACYHAFLLTNPNRLVIDIQTAS